MDERLQATVALLLALVNEPGAKARALAKTTGYDRSLLNSILYGRSDLFEGVGAQPPQWYLRAGARAEAATTPAQHEPDPRATTSSATSGLPFVLRPWQAEALKAWTANSRCGIVEAVTGVGKTKLGIAAIENHLRLGGSAAVIVPTIELQSQWFEELSVSLPGVLLGRLGNGHADTLASCEVVVAVARSASKYALGLPKETAGLLVADECHRYGSNQLKLALESQFEARLGLSATYERMDGAHRSVLLPYFGSVVYSIDYPRAKRDGLIAPIVAASIGVEFTPDERARYDEAHEAASEARRRLIGSYGAPKEPFGEFMAYVNNLQRSGSRSEGIAAGQFMKHFTAKREILASTRAKHDALKALVPAFERCDRAIVFTNTTDSAESIAAQLRGSGLTARSHHSKLNAPERHQVLDDFRSGRVRVLATPMTLDEGIDVPEADLAVVVAASKQRRQMIQRLGRVVRPKADGRPARFVMVHVNDTSEDPVHGAHEAFLDDLTEVAESFEVMGLDKCDKHDLLDALKW